MQNVPSQFGVASTLIKLDPYLRPRVQWGNTVAIHPLLWPRPCYILSQPTIKFPFLRVMSLRVQLSSSLMFRMLTNLVIKLLSGSQTESQKISCSTHTKCADLDTSERLIQFNEEVASILQHPIYSAIAKLFCLQFSQIVSMNIAK